MRRVPPNGVGSAGHGAATIRRRWYTRRPGGSKGDLMAPTKEPGMLPGTPGTPAARAAQPDAAAATGTAARRPWPVRAALAARRHWLVAILLAAGLVLRVLALAAYHPA